MATLIVGCGYLGSRVAKQLVARATSERDDAVYAVTRRVERAAELEQQDIRSIVADVTDAATLSKLPAVDTVLVSVGYDRNSALSIHDTYVGGLKNVLDALSPDTQRVVYISSTGVYGQSDGEVVDEASTCEPEREGGKACLAAEELLRAHPCGEGGVILRLAGIYGPGRLPRSQLLIDQQPLPVDPDTYLNLIHVDDGAAAALAAFELPPTTSVQTYCISDGHALLRRTYFEELARQLGTPSPVFLASGGETKDRGTGHKRINNARALAHLGWSPRYPTWQVGLAASLGQP